MAGRKQRKRASGEDRCGRLLEELSTARDRAKYESSAKSGPHVLRSRLGCALPQAPAHSPYLVSPSLFTGSESKFFYVGITFKLAGLSMRKSLAFLRMSKLRWLPWLSLDPLPCSKPQTLSSNLPCLNCGKNYNLFRHTTNAFLG